MTARDDAIKAMEWADTGLQPHSWTVLNTLLDAIPGPVLVRLAIERGALVETSVYEPELEQTYRVVES